MKGNFFIGVSLGMLAGALVIANSVKARQMVKNASQQAMSKVKGSSSKSKK